MQIHYLGTAAAEGWPALFCSCKNCREARQRRGRNCRSRAQALIDGCLMMDFGPDTFYHAMKYGLDMSKVGNVLLTHSHTDHFYPTELILKAAPYADSGAQNAMTIYGNEKCHWMFLNTQEVEDDSANFRECVKFQEIGVFADFDIPGYHIKTLKAFHDPKEDCLLYVIKDSTGKSLLYGNDTGYFPEATWEALKGIKFDGVSLDCTLGKNSEMTWGHMGLAANREVVRRLKDIGCIDNKTQIVLTHFSHNDGLLYEEAKEAVAKDGFIIAYDGMVLEL